MIELERLGLLEPGAEVSMTRLTGGVSSDIWRVECSGRCFVVKRALAQLKVAAEWHAPVIRNHYEAAWMRTVASIAPHAVPRLLAVDQDAGLFAMEYCDFPVWKSQLLAGRVDKEFAISVGGQLAAIHASTANDDEVERAFPTSEIFRAIRLEPYLEATARQHPAVRDHLFTLSRDTLGIRSALVHGDVSPKNILVGPRGPVFLDAECAWYGDPAFDVAFCLNHLLLKCIAVPAAAPDLLAAFDALAEAYFSRVRWEPRSAIEARAARLLAGLFLARVDGKSPVEYITRDEDRDLVRSTALPLIAVPPPSPAALRQAWAARFGLST